MAHRLPKIAPIVVERVRVQAWLEFHAQTAMRYICAPAGSGKTTSAVLYARSRPSGVVFVPAPPNSGEAMLIAAIARSAGISATHTYLELVEALAALAPLEIIIDNCDGFDAQARDLLGRIYLDVPDGVTFVYLARAQDAVPMSQARAHGLVDVCDPAIFAFDEAEIARFAQSLDLGADSASIASIHAATHGWAVAVAGVCRTAAADRLPLPDAMNYWRRLNEAAIGELITDAREGAPPAIRTAFDATVAGRCIADRVQLETFRRAGLFVGDWNGRPALNPLVCRHPATATDRAVGAPAAAAHIELFGRFDMRIDGQAVRWLRRRDGQIIQYLATRPHGRATRADVIATFWPEVDRQLAGQSLRSACSTIRRAIGECVGRAQVGRYFVGDQSLRLVLENTIISTAEFTRAFELAEAAYRRNDAADALTQYRSAERSYRAPFLCGEPPAAWTIPYEAQFAAMNVHVANRLDELNGKLEIGVIFDRQRNQPLQRVSA